MEEKAGHFDSLFETLASHFAAHHYDEVIQSFGKVVDICFKDSDKVGKVTALQLFTWFQKLLNPALFQVLDPLLMWAWGCRTAPLLPLLKHQDAELMLLLQVLKGYGDLSKNKEVYFFVHEATQYLTAVDVVFENNLAHAIATLYQQEKNFRLSQHYFSYAEAFNETLKNEELYLLAQYECLKPIRNISEKYKVKEDSEYQGDEPEVLCYEVRGKRDDRKR